METMSNWLGFDADLMRNNQEMQQIIAELTIAQLEMFYKDHWEKWDKLITPVQLSAQDPIMGAILPEIIEND